MALPILDGNQSATTLSTILAGGEHTPAHTVVSLGSIAISNITSAVSGSVVSISNFPATQPISGTVTATSLLNSTVENYDETVAPNVIAVHIKDTANNIFGVSPFPISGTVTVGMLTVENSANSFPNQQTPVQLKANSSDGSLRTRLEYVAGAFSDTSVVGYKSPSVEAGSVVTYAYLRTHVNNSVTIGSLPAISGTVTANNPSGALTTRFGSVVTANLATLTSAVTNTSRKYLLVQNIATSTVTIGIGFAPTTTQGIQLTAGAGLTFDAFCPTGGVWWLSSTTGSNFSILEG